MGNRKITDKFRDNYPSINDLQRTMSSYDIDINASPDKVKYITVNYDKIHRDSSIVKSIKKNIIINAKYVALHFNKEMATITLKLPIYFLLHNIKLTI